VAADPAHHVLVVTSHHVFDQGSHIQCSVLAPFCIRNKTPLDLNLTVRSANVKLPPFVDGSVASGACADVLSDMTDPLTLSGHPPGYSHPKPPVVIYHPTGKQRPKHLTFRDSDGASLRLKFHSVSSERGDIVVSSVWRSTPRLCL